jgi:hypothetical protein
MFITSLFQFGLSIYYYHEFAREVETLNFDISFWIMLTKGQMFE